MDLEGAGFVIGLIGAIWIKSSMNLMREYKEQPVLKMIGRDTENPALKAFVRGLGLGAARLGNRDLRALVFKLNEIGLTALDRGNGAVKRTRRVCHRSWQRDSDLFRLWPGSLNLRNIATPVVTPPRIELVDPHDNDLNDRTAIVSCPRSKGDA